MFWIRYLAHLGFAALVLLNSCHQKAFVEISKKSLVLDLENEGRIQNLFNTSLNNEEVLVAYDVVNSELHVRSLFNKRINEIYDLNKLTTLNQYSCVGAEPNKPFFRAIGLTEERTILALEYETNRLFILNQRDTIVFNTLSNQAYSAPNQGGLKLIDSNLILSFMGATEDHAYFEESTAIFDLRNENHSTHFIPYPEIFNFYKSNQLVRPYLLIIDSLAYITFALKEYAIAYNLETAALDTIKLQNSNPPQFQDYRVLEKPLFNSYREQQSFIENSEELYGPLLHDPFRNLYYRMCIRASSVPREEYISDSAILNKTCEMLVYDSDFEPLYVYELDGSLDPRSMLVTSKGILIAKKEMKRESFDFTPKRIKMSFFLLKVNAPRKSSQNSSKT